MRAKAWPLYAASTIAIACAVMFGSAVAANSAPGDGRVVLRASHPEWATAANRVSGVASTESTAVRVYLHTRDDARLRALATAVADPGNPQYHHFLSAADVRARFAPSDGAVASVRNWLSGAGLKVVDVPRNRMYVDAEGAAARVASAFRVQFGLYRVHSETLRGTDRDLSVPRRVAAVVAGVTGVSDPEVVAQPRHPLPPPDGVHHAPPCSAFWGEKLDTTDPPYGGGFPSPLPYAPCGYTPPQLRAAYGLSDAVDVGLDGTGVTVAIIDPFGSPTIFGDASEYARRHDPDHPLDPSQLTQLIAPPNRKAQARKRCDAKGKYQEETLDVEAVHALAPGANIVYLGTADCYPPAMFGAINDVVANERANIVSNSWGFPGEAQARAGEETILLEAAVQGIGVYFASGDAGDNAAILDLPQPDYPASSPFVTAVGGTSLGIGADGSRVFETGWESGRSELVGGTYVPGPPGEFIAGSGGGASRVFRQPDYQQGVVPDDLALSNGEPPRRTVPDVAMVGDGDTGMLVGETQRFAKRDIHYDEYASGGTSLSCPLFAGVVALADQLAGSPHGFINPLLYGREREEGGLLDIDHVNEATVRVFFRNAVDASDGTVTTVRTFDLQSLAIATRPGYDLTTGLGVPNGVTFLLNS